MCIRDRQQQSEEQEADKDGESARQLDMAYLHENVAVTTIAVDPVHHVGPGAVAALPAAGSRPRPLPEDLGRYPTEYDECVHAGEGSEEQEADKDGESARQPDMA